MKRFFKKTSGFTLIELMIVIAIIAILAAILIPNFIRARAQSQLSACESNEKNMATSLEMYSTDNQGNYPGPAGATTAMNAAWLTANLGIQYMRAPAVCPANQAFYSYNAAALPINNYTILQGAAGATAAHGVIIGANTTYPQYYARGGLLP